MENEDKALNAAKEVYEYRFSGAKPISKIKCLMLVFTVCGFFWGFIYWMSVR